MIHLFGYEFQRQGDFSIEPGQYGCVTVYSSNPYLVFMGTGSQPDTDFNFSMKCSMKDGTNGTIEFLYEKIKEHKYGKILFSVNGLVGCTITIVSAVSFPLAKPVEGECKIQFPKCLAIGHRGMGANQVSSEYMENSMPGFFGAFIAKADCVEFDVQLSAEGTPVIYHDFFILRDEKYPNIEPVKVKKNGKFAYSVSQLSNTQFMSSSLELKWKALRPDFNELMDHLPKSLMFDIEIKYPFSNRFDGKVPYPERNAFLQATFDDMVIHMGERPCFFSAFDPLIVAMLCTKQRRWPVLQLITVEKNETIDQFPIKVRALIPLHKKLGVIGFVADSEKLLKFPDLIHDLQNEGFIVATYGKPNNTEDGIKQQINLGIGAICADLVPQLRKVIDEIQ